jgi:hypothetical protein
VAGKRLNSNEKPLKCSTFVASQKNFKPLMKINKPAVKKAIPKPKFHPSPVVKQPEDKFLDTEAEISIA